jgi:hypothetical protein
LAYKGRFAVSRAVLSYASVAESLFTTNVHEWGWMGGALGSEVSWLCDYGRFEGENRKTGSEVSW